MGEQNNDVRKRRHLTPEEKYQIFIEATMAEDRLSTDDSGIASATHSHNQMAQKLTSFLEWVMLFMSYRFEAELR